MANLLGVPWHAALILGAAVAPPDATAVAALGRTLPHRNFMLLKAESLTNDGTALVVYAIAVGVAVGGHYTPLAVTGLVLLSYLGGIAAGAVVAGVAYLVMRRLRDSTAINVALLLTPFTAYLQAELFGASGVLAVVVAGLVIAFVSPRISTAGSRRMTEGAWPLGSVLLNGSLFVLIGLEVQAVARELDAAELGRLTVVVVAVWLTLLVVRFVFQVTSVSLIRLLDRRPSQLARRMSHRTRVVSAVAGFRGAVSLAIALSVPVVLDDGSAFPGREAIVFVTAGVIILTLLVQGPLLPAVVRWARFPADTASTDEQRFAERAMRDAAIAAVPGLAREHGIRDEVRDRVARDYQELVELVEEHEQERDGDSPPSRHEELTRLRLAVLDHKREVLTRFVREGVVDGSVALQIQMRLDVEELRLTGVEPLD
ncbi:Na+/H+ antiporter [Antribacter soli]|uniref:Na+/H+ antiporter n=1 Tax=Antribacter soli TaxID=2910976 RepID=UPI0027E0219D|nr:Na+/H+ antiporter [Antribacter soli]